MRLAIFSDIHANLPAMQVVSEHILAGGYDAVYCLGDIGGYSSQPNEVQALIMAMGCPTVSGNYDDNVGNDGPDCGCHYIKPFDIQMSDISFSWTKEHTTARNKAWLRILAKEIRLNAGDYRVLLCHGSPTSNTEYLFETRSDGYLRQFTPGGKRDAGADVIVFGHTHVPYHRKVDDTHFINSGSVGRPKDGDPRAGYAIVTIEGKEIAVEQVRLEYDVEATCARLIDAGLPTYFADYLRTGGMTIRARSAGTGR